MNHYEALGVPVDAEEAEIRKAYLAAARRHHPDFHVADDPVVREGHARTMQVVNEAWEVLGHRASRQRYDLTLRSRASSGPSGGGTSPPEPPPGKGWTPRRDDDGWRHDYRAWADETDLLPPDGPGARARRGTVAVLPVGLFLIGVLVGFVGLVVESRPLLTGALMAVIVASILFMVLPLVQMARGRHRD